MILRTKLESLLFVATRPLSIKKLAELTGATVEDVDAAMTEISQALNTEASGINIVRHGQHVQMVSSPLASALVTAYLKEEQAGELTRPALETLTIIAYRGPISKIQLDTIRGVNCALILRNLMVKGLVESKSSRDKFQTSYTVTLDFVKYLGLNHISELPDYLKLNQDETLDQLLNPSGQVVSEESSVEPSTT